MIRAEPIKARPSKRATHKEFNREQVNAIAAQERLAAETKAAMEICHLEARIRELEAKQRRAPYRGGTSVEARKPWLTVNPPMSRRTWYRHEAKRKKLCAAGEKQEKN